MRNYCLLLAACVGISLAVSAGIAHAQSFTAGNLAVVRVGDGSAALTGVGTATFIDQYTVGGVLKNSLALPTSANGSNRQFVLSGTAASEGFLNLSANGQYLTLGGYDAAVGTASITTSTSAAVNRVVARVDLSGTVDTTTALTDAPSGSNIRSVASVDGSSFYVAGGANGIRYASLGATTSTQLNTAPTNNRVVSIYNGQLYLSSGSGTATTTLGVSSLGSGTPTTTGQTSTLLATPGGTGTVSPYDFFLTPDALTLYVTDDRANGSGGLYKFTRTSSASTFAQAYFGSPTATTGLRGLTAAFDGTNYTFYGTTTQASANQIVSVTDNGSAFIYNTIATAAANTAFRGLEFIPSANSAATPEPGTFALVGFGLLPLGGTLLRKRRKK